MSTHVKQPIKMYDQYQFNLEQLMFVLTKLHANSQVLKTNPHNKPLKEFVHVVETNT